MSILLTMGIVCFIVVTVFVAVTLKPFLKYQDEYDVYRDMAQEMIITALWVFTVAGTFTMGVVFSLVGASVW